jgi:hypothetical protein
MVLPHQVFTEIPMLQFLQLMQEPHVQLTSGLDGFSIQFIAYGIPYKASLDNDTRT